MSKELFTNPGSFIQGDCFEVIENNFWLEEYVDLLFMDPEYDKLELAATVRRIAPLKSNATVICFMYPEDVNLCEGLRKPDRVYHWIKPGSIKNTSKRSARFVEAICVWYGGFFNQELDWSNRRGIFYDNLVEVRVHEHQKPKSLVERLIKLHCPPGGTVLDPFAGSQVVRMVCDEFGFNSLSIDVSDYAIAA